MFNKIKTKAITMVAKVNYALCNKKAEGFVDTGVKILISVVIGALLLAGLYTLFGDTILPTLTEKIKGLFNYAG
jgi:hypothetical protein